MIGKLIGVATAGSTLAGVTLLRRLLYDGANIIMLAVVSAFMFSLMVLGVFVTAYACLVHYGLDPFVSGVTVGVVAFFVTIILFTLTVHKLNQLRDLTHKCLNTSKLGALDINGLTHSFIDGFLNSRK
jgi:hypothetical protein